MRDLAKPRQGTSHLTFVIWAAIVSVGLIVASIALGVGIDPSVSMFASP
jgi:hypothetical protein